MNRAPESIAAYKSACERQLALSTSDDITRRLAEGPANRRAIFDCVAALHGHAEEGNVEIWFCLGDAYSSGRGPERDVTLSQQWFRRAAEAGHPRSMVRLGLSLQRADSVELQREGIHWLERAAEHGDASAMTFLGFSFRDGGPWGEDAQRARDWFKRAFEAGELQASLYLGRLFARNLRDPEQAAHWLLLAAEMGFEESYVDLAMLYGDRHSRAHKPDESAKWYRKVANGGGGSALRALIALARATRDGQGVPQNRELARSYLEIALQIAPNTGEFRREAEKLLAQIDSSLI